MKKLLLIVASLFLSSVVQAQTSNSGRFINGLAAARPTCSTNPLDQNAHNGDIYNDTDDGNTFKCNGGVWGPLVGISVSTLPNTTVSFTAAPSFSGTVNAAYSMTLTGNVTSSTISGVPVNGNLLAFHICQDATGSRTFAWPANFLVPTAIQSAANFCTDETFKFDGTNWSQLTQPASGGGGGGTSVGPQGTVQEVGATGGSFAKSPLVDIGGSGTEVQESATHETKGPTPEVDIQLFGGRAVATDLGAPFSNTGVTGTCTSGNTTIPLSGAGDTRFVNGDGIVLYNCGPSHSMSTPSAPTVTSAIALTNTGTGYVATNASAGSVNNRCYKIVARDLAQGLTAASPEVCVTGGSSNIGPNPPISITSHSRSGQTVTVVSSAHTLPVGCSNGSCGAVYISGTSDDANFSGWFPLASVPDSTHFTYGGGLSVANGATASATGGQFIYFNSDHLVLPAFGTGMWQYGIYEGATGAETLVGVSLPNISALAGTPSYLTWDYYGSTYSGNSSLPFFWPNTPPTSATNDSLVTTIVSGGGTTSLVVAAAPSNTPTSASTALFDNCPTAQAASTFANSFSGGGGVLAFPAVPAAAGHMAYVFNSNCSLSGTVSQSMPVNLYDTLRFQGKWNGQRNPNGLYEFTVAFGIEPHVPIYDTRANPGILFTGGSWRGTNIIPVGNNYVAMLYSVNGTSRFEDMAFGQVQAGDYNGILFYDFQSSTSGSFGYKMDNVAFISGPNQMAGASFTPLLITKNNFEMHWDNIPMCCRGMWFQPITAGISMSFDQRQEVQGLTEPQFSFYYAGGGNTSGWVYFKNIWQDTTQQPSFTNFATGLGSFGAQLIVDGANGPGGSNRLISGAPFASVVLRGITHDTASLGQNVNLHIDGGLRAGEQEFSSPVIVGAANSLYVDSAANWPAPTCSVAAAGPPFTQAFTSATFSYYPVFFNGGIGHASLPSNSCTADGVTQQATITIPSTIPGVTGYIIGKSGFQFGTLLPSTSCATPQTTSLTTVLWQNCGNGLSVVPLGGPSGLQTGQVWGDFFPNSPNNVANAMPTYDLTGKLVASGCVPSAANSFCKWNGAAWAIQALPAGNLVGTGQTNTFTTGVQDFSAVTEFRPKFGLTSAIPTTCTVGDIYEATDALAGQNWYFCTATNTWTQQLNTGTYTLNTYGGSHTLASNEQWANFTATSTATVLHALTNHRWVVFCVSPCVSLTIAPDSGNITLNNVTATTATITTGLGAQVACDGTNCFAWGLGGSGGGSGTVSSGTVNGPAYYNAPTTVGSITPPTTPAGVTYTETSTPSGGVSQPPTLSLPGIVGRAVSGTTATDTILSTDCNPNRVEYVGSVAVAVTLPTAVTLGVSKCVYKLINATSPTQTVTITPTTWTVNGNATLALTFGQQAWFYVDPNSSTNWVADVTDLAGNVCGAPVPVSAKLLGSNSSCNLIAAALSNTHIYVGNGSNLPVDVAASGDVSLANTGAFTVLGANGGTFPASANVLGTNSSKQPVTATAHNIILPWECADSSGSGTAQVCNTSPTFTPVAGDGIIYTTTTANSGTGLTINVNSLGAKSVAKWQTSTTLAANDIKANTQVLLTYDGTNWELTTIGNAPTGGGGGTPCTTTANSVQYNNGGAFGCMTEFTYASSTLTLSSTGKIDLSATSVTAGLKLPTAAGASPTNAGIFSYDSTNNRIVVGNATNTSIIPWFTTAPTTNVLRKASGTAGLLVDSTITDNGTLISTTEGVSIAPTSTSQVGLIVNNPTSTTVDIADFEVNGTKEAVISNSGEAFFGPSAPNPTVGTSGGIMCVEGTAPTGLASDDSLYCDSTQHAVSVNNNNTGNMPVSRIVCSNVTPVTVNTNTTSDQNLMSCTLSANLLNVSGRVLKVTVAGVYSTAAASTASITMKVKLCTVSGCGSGTVITPLSATTGATAALSATNLMAQLFGNIITQTAGASSAYEAQGSMYIDLSATATVASSVYPAINTATVGTIDSTGQLFLQITGAFSAGSTSNSMTERQLLVEVLN